MVKGMIIRESLTDASVLSRSPFTVREMYPLLLDRSTPVEIVIVEVSEEEMLGAMTTLSRVIKSERYYAHFVFDQRKLFIVFPHNICVVEKGNANSERIGLRIGALFKVPAHQMPFGRMFKFEHSEDENG